MKTDFVKDFYYRQEFEAFRPQYEDFMDAHNTGKVTGIIVTLKGGADKGFVDRQGEPYDFVSRFFAPWSGVPEDPVTGGSLFLKVYSRSLDGKVVVKPCVYQVNWGEGFQT